MEVLDKGDTVSKWIGWDECHLFDPASGKSDEQSPSRKCLSDRIAFIKYTYPFKDPHNEAEPDTEEVIDRPNRVLQVLSAEDGQVTWGEQKLLKLDKGKEIWQAMPRLSWISLQGGQGIPLWQALSGHASVSEGTGFLLRRADFTFPTECTLQIKNEQERKIVNLLELFIPNDITQHTISKDPKYIYMRWVPFYCGQDLGTSFRIGQVFTNSGWRIASIGRDPNLANPFGILWDKLGLTAR